MLDMFDYARSVLEVAAINILLSSDNAVIIALAARDLPDRRRKQALLLGGASAIVIQLGFTLAVAYLIQIPGIRLIGAVFLAWIACRLLRDESRDVTEPGAPASFGSAIASIVFANLVVSLDNALAVAGASGHDPARLVLGLVLSATVILGCSTMILRIVARYRWVAVAGAGLLAYTAAEMMCQDFESAARVTHWHVTAVAVGAVGLHGYFWAFKAFIVSTCLASAKWWPRPSGI